MVSNGESITSTSEDGSFSLEINPEVDRHVFVTVPGGFRADTGFSKEVVDLASGPGLLEFELEPFAPSGSRHFTFAHITDTHVGLKGGTTTPPDRLQNDLAAVMDDSSPDLVVASGDLTQWGNPDQLRAVATAAEILSCPWFPMFGGHDGNYERLSGTTAEEMAGMKRTGAWEKIRALTSDLPDESFTHNFEQLFGPPYYSFDWSEWHFVLFPNEAFFSSTDEKRKGQWLWSDIGHQPDGRAVAVVVHIPPSSEFLDRLEQAGVKLVLHGHWHSSKVMSWGAMTVAAAPPLCFGGLDTSPRGYHRIDFEGSTFQLERRILSFRGIHINRDAGPGLRWECKLPGHTHRAAPVRCGESILASIQNPRFPGASGVACVDDVTGSMTWFLETENVISNRVAIDQTGTRGVAVSLTGSVIVFETASGSVIWTAKLPNHPFRWLHPPPLIVGDQVIAGGRAGYGCWDLQGGTKIWYHKLGEEDKWPSFSGPVAWEELLILAMGDGLEAIDLRTGERIWHRPINISQRFSSPVLVGDRVVHGGDWNKLSSRGEEPAGLVVLDAATGEEIWNRNILEAGYATGLTANKELIFASTPHGEVQAYDIESSELCWRYATGDSRLDVIPYMRDGSCLLADPVVKNGEVMISGCDGVVVVLDAKTGSVRQSIELGSGITSPVCPLDDGFCVATFDGHLFRFGQI